MPDNDTVTVTIDSDLNDRIIAACPQYGPDAHRPRLSLTGQRMACWEHVARDWLASRHSSLPSTAAPGASTAPACAGGECRCNAGGNGDAD